MAPEVIKHPVQWVMGRWVGGANRETNLSPLSSAEAKNEWR